MYIQLEQSDTIDPRILRTRELLINAFAKLFIEHKSIRKITVQSVAAEAGVNRVTFYAHFSDKYELLHVWARLMFRQSVAETLPIAAPYNLQNIAFLINATLDFFIMRSEYQRRVNDQLELMFAAAIQLELKDTLEGLLEMQPSTGRAIPLKIKATFLSWSIYGSAHDWSCDHKHQSKEIIAQQLISMCAGVIEQ